MIQFHSIWELVSFVANIIFPLLISFQWYKNHAKEQTVKNGIFASRRMIERMHEQNAIDVLDNLDATLATLGARKPFKDAIIEHVTKIISFTKKDDSKPLLNLPPEFRSSFEDRLENASRRKNKN